MQRLHLRHPKGHAVMHTHQSHTAAICALEDPSLLMINQNSLRFYNVSSSTFTACAIFGQHFTNAPKLES